LIAVQHQRVIVGLEAADQREDRRHVAAAEQRTHLLADLEGVRPRVVGAVVEAGAATRRAALGKVIRDHHQPRAASSDHLVHVGHQRLAQVRPAEVEDAPQVAERLDDAGRRLRGNRDVDAPVHALEHHDRGGVLRQVALAGQPGAGAGKGLGMAAGEVEDPVDALADRRQCDVVGDGALRHGAAAWRPAARRSTGLEPMPAGSPPARALNPPAPTSPRRTAPAAS
jgi:hypothetical protein